MDLANAERTELDALLLVHHEMLAAVPVHCDHEALGQVERDGADR
ncbi:hypothetical protein [Burkholderia lata]|nr:hypothetical protein [Burkholderia lata]